MLLLANRRLTLRVRVGLRVPACCIPLGSCQFAAVTQQLFNRGALRGYGAILFHY